MDLRLSLRPAGTSLRVARGLTLPRTENPPRAEPSGPRESEAVGWTVVAGPSRPTGRHRPCWQRRQGGGNRATSSASVQSRLGGGGRGVRVQRRRRMLWGKARVRPGVVTREESVLWRRLNGIERHGKQRGSAKG